MASIQENIEKSITVMNIAAMEMMIEDEYQTDFEELFDKAAKNVERLLRIKTLAEGKKCSEQEE